MTTQRSKIQSLQILRALAATSVVYLHIGCEPWFGGFGVDIFFVLSGFVMCYITDSGESGKEFFLRRIARVVPLYWLLTLFAFVLAFLKPTLFNSTTADLGNLLRSLFFIPYAKENGSISPITSATVFFKSRWQLTATLMIAISFCIANLLKEVDDVFVFLSDQIVFEFILGIALYFLNKKIAVKMQSLGWVKNLVVVIICYAFMVLMDVFRFEGMRALTLGVPSSIMLLCFLNLESMFCKWPAALTGLLAEIGDASYATYLSHLYVIEGLRKIVFVRINPDWMYTPIGVGISLISALVVGQCLYCWLDRPLSRALRNRLIKL
jgi:peptidoglycan/LPS O-acetylase OafA/YrhL